MHCTASRLNLVCQVSLLPLTRVLLFPLVLINQIQHSSSKFHRIFQTHDWPWGIHRLGDSCDVGRKWWVFTGERCWLFTCILWKINYWMGRGCISMGNEGLETIQRIKYCCPMYVFALPYLVASLQILGFWFWTVFSTDHICKLVSRLATCVFHFHSQVQRVHSPILLKRNVYRLSKLWKLSSSYCVRLYLWWGCRRNLKLITLGSDSVKCSQNSASHCCITLSLLRVINVKIPLQPHKKYDITQYGELGFS